AGANHDPEAQTLQPPAKICFLHMREQIRIKSPGLVESGFPDKHRGAACPENGPGIVVLAAILFGNAENPSPAEQVPKTVYVTAGRTGVFESFSLAVSFDLGLAGGNFRVAFH